MSRTAGVPAGSDDHNFQLHPWSAPD